MYGIKSVLSKIGDGLLFLIYTPIFAALLLLSLIAVLVLPALASMFLVDLFTGSAPEQSALTVALLATMLTFGYAGAMNYLLYVLVTNWALREISNRHWVGFNKPSFEIVIPYSMQLAFSWEIADLAERIIREHPTEYSTQSVSRIRRYRWYLIVAASVQNISTALFLAAMIYESSVRT